MPGAPAPGGCSTVGADQFQISKNKRRNAKGDQPNNIAPLFSTRWFTPVPTRLSRPMRAF